jgi:propanol-preferring alcohol dehydrogenase
LLRNHNLVEVHAMKAAVLREFKTPLSIEEIAQPQPAAHEALIEVEACGVCHSDLHLADADWPQLARIIKKPLILGHEIAGRIVEKGASVENLQVGDRVGVPWLHWSCGECEFCREGNENLCVKQQITGVTVDGGFAEFVKAPASHVLKIPEQLSASDAAPLFCAGVTVYRALQHAKIQPGQRLAVFGVGGLGQLAVQIGAGLGAAVTAVDVSDEKLAHATTLGASATSAAKAAYDTAFLCVRPTGILLVVGLPAESICFPPISMAASEVRIQASSVGTRQDLRAVLTMAAAGKIRSQVTTRPLAQVNEAMAELRNGTVSGRIVLTPH